MFEGLMFVNSNDIRLAALDVCEQCTLNFEAHCSTCKLKQLDKNLQEMENQMVNEMEKEMTICG